MQETSNTNRVSVPRKSRGEVMHMSVDEQLPVIEKAAHAYNSGAASMTAACEVAERLTGVSASTIRNWWNALSPAHPKCPKWPNDAPRPGSGHNAGRSRKSSKRRLEQVDQLEAENRRLAAEITAVRDRSLQNILTMLPGLTTAALFEVEKLVLSHVTANNGRAD